VELLLDRVLDVLCCHHNNLLPDHLDVAEIAWMRLTGHPTMAKHAARMARSRLTQLRLSYSVLVDGMVRFRPPSFFENRRRLEEQEGVLVPRNGGTIPSGRQVELYNVLVNRDPLSNACSSRRSSPEDKRKAAAAATESASRIDTFVPKVSKDFRWASALLNPEGNDEPVGQNDTDNESQYCGHLVRVYLEKVPRNNPVAHEDGNRGGISSGGKLLPEKDLLFLLSDRLEVARFRIDPRVVGGLGVHATVPENRLTYEVTSSEKEERATTDTDTSAKMQYSGCFRLLGIKFDFKDLLGVYVRKRLPLAKREMQEVRVKRPVTRVEKEYVKALAKAAREAPGNADAFEGMKGW